MIETVQIARTVASHPGMPFGLIPEQASKNYHEKSRYGRMLKSWMPLADGLTVHWLIPLHVTPEARCEEFGQSQN